jgi:hypothetical protein
MTFAVSSFVPFFLVLAVAILAARRDARAGMRRSVWRSPPAAAAVFAVVVVGTCWALWGRLELLPLAAAAAAFAPRVGRLSEEAKRGMPDRSPARRWVAPLATGAATLAVTWWVWSAWNPVPWVFDETAYVLQAGIFASGRWADAAPPLPTFFDQVHVLSYPARAAKYPPGHALALAAGAAAGLPALVPLLLNGAAGAMLFALARRASNATAAWFAWLVWIGCPGGLFYRSSYFSEVTTTLLWLVGWWLLWNWRDDGRVRDLCAFGLCVGWGFITRPLTTLAFLIPAGVFLLRATAARRSWRALAAAAIPGLVLLLVIPLWSQRTTGDWRVTPLQLYTRDYLPYDQPGFHDAAFQPPRRQLPPAVRSLYVQYLRLNERHTLAAVPRLLHERSVVLLRDAWGGWRGWLVAFAVLGLVLLPAQLRLPAWSVALLLALHLAYAHFRTWSLYYVEGQTFLAFLTGLGLQRAASATGPRVLHRRGLRLLAAALAAALLVLTAADVEDARVRFETRLEEQTRFRESLGKLQKTPAIVFVRYGAHHDPNRGLVSNGPRLAGAPVWVVYDLGGENARLCALAPERTPYLYDETRRRFQPLGAGCRGPSL